MRRRILASLGGGWKNPYVTDGLVAMWDGEWNAGGGVHDPNATVWMDLSGNGNDAPLYTSSSPTWEDNAIVCPSRSSGCVAYLDYTFENVLSIECVFDGVEQAASAAGGCLIAFGSGRQCIAFSSGSGKITLSLMNTTDTSKVAIALLGKIRSGVAFSAQASFADKTTPLLGRLNGETSETNYAFGNGITGSQFVIGSRSKTQTLAYVGRLYSIRLYSKELSSAELDANYAIDKARFNLPDAA